MTETSQNPKVSVLMPVRNGLPFVSAAIESILSQTFRDFEFIIIDDGSTDATPASIEVSARSDARIRVVTRPAEGIRASLNLGLELAKGPYIARMDADDIALPQRLEWQVRFLDQSPDVLAVGGQTWAMDEDDDVMYAIRCPTESAEIEQTLLAGRNCMSHPTMMFRKDAVTQVGGYTEEYPTDDYGLWLRLIERGALANLPQFVLQYRFHPQAGSIEKHMAQQQAGLRLLEAAHTRRGTTPPAVPVGHAPQSIARIHHHWAMSAVRDRQWKAARKHAIQALRLEPGNLHGWWTLLKATFKINRAFTGQR